MKVLEEVKTLEITVCKDNKVKILVSNTGKIFSIYGKERKVFPNNRGYLGFIISNKK